MLRARLRAGSSAKGASAGPVAAALGKNGFFRVFAANLSTTVEAFVLKLYINNRSNPWPAWAQGLTTAL